MGKSIPEVSKVMASYIMKDLISSLKSGNHKHPYATSYIMNLIYNVT